jgi:hypothetical protein
MGSRSRRSASTTSTRSMTTWSPRA